MWSASTAPNNYESASEDWQRYFKRFKDIPNDFRDVYVVLLDPATGKPTVWLRNPRMAEHPLIGYTRAFSWIVLPGKLTNAPKVAQGARVAAKPVLAQRALFDIARFLRLAEKSLDAVTPEQFFGKKLWESLGPTMQAIIRPRFPYFIGKGAEIRGGKVLETAGLTLFHEGRQIQFTVVINGKEVTRIFDHLANEEILRPLMGWLAKPGKPIGPPAGIEIKFASSRILKDQTVKSEMLVKAGRIVAEHVMRVPANRVKHADIAQAINGWLANKKGSRILTGRQEEAFKVLVQQLQRKRLSDGTVLTLGQVLGLGLLLALKVENRPLLPPPPIIVPSQLLNPDEA